MLLNPTKPKASRISLIEKKTPEAFEKLLHNYWTWHYEGSLFKTVELLLCTDLEWEKVQDLNTPPVGEVVSPLGYALAHTEKEVRDAALAVLDFTVYIPKGIVLLGEECTPIEIDEFEIGVYPITNAQYLRFLQETQYEPSQHWIDNLAACAEQLSIESYGFKGDHPVVWVSYKDAEAYADYVDARIPTFAEWQYSARGNDDRLFPWGNEIDKPRCNTTELGAVDTTPVGSFQDGISPFGCYDMVGNVWEWTSTAYDEAENFMVACGGAWYYNHDYSTCISYDYFSKDYAEFVIGYRIAR